MELVHGIKITEYSDQNHLSTRERLGLFVQVCQAIQHAHQKGIGSSSRMMRRASVAIASKPASGIRTEKRPTRGRAARFWEGFMSIIIGLFS